MNPLISQSAWRRGWNDAWNIATTSRAFWAFEAVGGVIIGAINGWWAVAWLAGGCFCVWLGATASAPIRQRNEAIEKIRCLQPIRNPDWLNLPDAAAFYRDELDCSKVLEEDRANYDVWGAECRSNTPYAMFFASLLRQGVNLGVLNAKGKPNNGSAVVDLKPPIQLVENADDIDSAILGSDDRIYEKIEVNRDSIRDFVKILEKEEMEAQESPEQGQH
ncbi:hypothetical protein [Roseovarius sp. D0-M9]|uniref:hypothetical protein n=1 Tax=Roseovarius sp. D0-M9 TaxID=3127117 RepID=UPI00300F8263